MEILKGHTSEVRFTVPNSLALATFTVERNGVAVGGTFNATVADGVAVCQLPYAAVTTDATLVVTLRFNYETAPYVVTKNVEVSTPYLEVFEIKEIYPEATQVEAVELEAAVRHIINAHTGQSFGFSEDRTYTVEAHGEEALRLPKRLVELKGLSTLTAVLDIRGAIVTSDGWYLKKGWAGELSSIENDSTYWSGWEPTNDAAPGEPGYEKSTHGHVIVPPTVHTNPTPWRNDYPFNITGDWGYVSVPEPVRQAAKLLVNDYACSEIAYRDRFLSSIASADWRMQFFSNAWASTGNARADQLLADYHIVDWVVV